MEGDLNIGLAFFAGLISFISPCVLPLVPAYIGYMGGRLTRQVTLSSSAAKAQTVQYRQRFQTLLHGLFFVAGFTLFFVTFGLLTTAAVSSLTEFGATEAEVRDAIARVGGTAVILFGLQIMGVLPRVLTWLQGQAVRLDRNPYGNLISALVGITLIGAVYWLFIESWFMTLLALLLFTQLFHDALRADTPGDFWSRVILRLQSALYMDTRHQSQPKNQYGYLGSLVMGIVFSAGWTPCIGPVYGAVLTLASSGQELVKSAYLLLAYSLGLGIPFLLTALALDRAQGVLRRLQRNVRTIEAVSGAFLIAIGVLVFTGQLQRLSQLGGEGSLGELSLDIENCAVGVVEGRVRLANVRECISGGGIKEDFYLAAEKNTAVAGLSGATFTPPGQDIPEGGLSVPTLGGPGETSAIPPLDVPQITNVAPEAEIPVGLRIGQRAPDFTAELLDGQMVSLSDFRGQVVLVNFWATWCGPCRKEMPDFQSVYDARSDEGFVVLAINNQESESDVAAFAEELGLTIPIVLDPSGTINGTLYRSIIPGYPTSLLIDQDGVIVAYFPGQMTGSELLSNLNPLLDS